MRWRAWAAAGVFGAGLVGWAAGLAQLDGRYWPREGHWSAERQEEVVARLKARTPFPTAGTIGYRDELNGNDPKSRPAAEYGFTLLCYALVPVLIDRTGDHPLTLVVPPQGPFYFEPRGGRGR
jgi:hypothetical protein